MSSDSETTQQAIDPFRELNRYDGYADEYRSDVVYEPPRRTLQNGWVKFHATRECGSQNVRYVESTGAMPTTDRYAYDLYCFNCGHRVDEQDVLFLGGEWYDRVGFDAYHRPVDDVQLPADRVVELGPDPAEDALVRALRLTRIEGRGDSLTGFSFGRGADQWETCSTCGHPSPLTFDGDCRLCYDGEWTQRMQDSVQVLSRLVRERNDSFKHRLSNHVDPLSIRGRAFSGSVLWRRAREHDTYPKLVYVDRVLQDYDDDHFEYVLKSLDDDASWLVDTETIRDTFYDTELVYRGTESPLSDDRIRNVYESVT